MVHATGDATMSKSNDTSASGLMKSTPTVTLEPQYIHTHNAQRTSEKHNHRYTVESMDCGRKCVVNEDRSIYPESFNGSAVAARDGTGGYAGG